MTVSLSSRRGLMLAAGLVAAGLSTVATARADDAKPVITVTAEGQAAVAPDMAVVSMTVLREAETARQALDDTNAAMNAVLEAMKGEGIADRDLQTADFSIQPRWVYPEAKNGVQPNPSIVGYQVSNTLSVRVRDLAKLGTVLDTSVTLGVNQGGNIAFTNDKPDETIDAARKDAVARAIAKAKVLAEAAGVGLGRITSISEQSYANPPVPMMRAEFAKAADSGAAPIASGENQYRVSVNITFEITQ